VINANTIGIVSTFFKINVNISKTGLFLRS
jgi:hypothetical protein